MVPQALEPHLRQAGDARLSEPALFYLALAALYLSECVTFVRKDALAVAKNWFAGWAVRCPSGLFGSQERGLVLSNPVPPFGTTLLAQAWPFSPSPEGIQAYAALTIHPEGRTREGGPFVPWADIAGVEVEDKLVRAGATELARADSDAGARLWAGLLGDLARAHPADREDGIQRALDRSLDRAAAMRRAQDLEEAGRWVRRIGIALWLHLFVAVPVVVSLRGIVFTWPILVLVALVLMWTIAAMFFGAHRRLHPGATGERLQAVFLFTFLPTAAIRASDYLARSTMAGLHPLAVAHALLDADAFKLHARKVVLDARTPLQPVNRTDDPRALGAEAWYRERLKGSLERFVRQQGIDPETLCAAPAPRDASSKSFCPRCDAQYTITEGTCSTCGAIDLKPLAVFTPAPKPDPA